jgi:hypothetical protein
MFSTLSAPRPTQSQGLSVKETIVFGPSEWDVLHLNPFHIHPDAQIRPVSCSGKKGFDLIRQSILQKNFDVTSLIVVWRDENKDPAAQPPRYYCVYGMHRIEVVQERITQKHKDWPPGCSILRSVRSTCSVQSCVRHLSGRKLSNER